MSSRRSFLVAGTGALAAFAPGGLDRVFAAGRATAGRSILEVAADEDYWREVQGAFTVNRAYINLNNGGGTPPPPLVPRAVKPSPHPPNDGPGSYPRPQP